MKKSMIAAGALVAGLLLPMNVSAQEQVSTPLEVRAEVVAGSCTIDPIAAVDFGSLDPASTSNITINFDVVWTCNNGLPFSLGADAGQNLEPSFPRRTVVDGAGSRIAYTFLIPDLGNVQWGDNGMLNETIPGSSITGTGTGTPQTTTVSAVLEPGLIAPTNAGLHTDTVTVKLEF